MVTLAFTGEFPLDFLADDEWVAAGEPLGACAIFFEDGPATHRVNIPKETLVTRVSGPERFTFEHLDGGS